MINSISQFEEIWKNESEATLKVLKQLTDASLAKAVEPQGRTLGRLAWHLGLSIPEMMNRTGLHISEPKEDAPVPSTAREICAAYEHASNALLQQAKTKWNDASLQTTDEMYGERWTKASTLQALIFHQIHHRAQMTVLMRQAGLKVPGVYGPSREEWGAIGMQPPKI